MKAEEYPDEGGQPSVGMHSVYRDMESRAAPDHTRTFVLEVDGEQFEVCVSVDPATGHTESGYDWLSGPKEGYGFGLGGPAESSVEEHQARIREFRPWSGRWRR